MVLLIHTGGTIGMAAGPDGLTPQPGLVEAAFAARMGRPGAGSAGAGGAARVVAFDPLLDSADVGPKEWNRILDLIEAEDGPVIVTHGTDTMAYSGAALSQALTGWRHRVVLTGAMHPLGTGGDAEGNLDLAVKAVLRPEGDRPDAGVWLAFAGRLLAAGQLVKTSSQADDAFRSVLAMGETVPEPSQTRALPWQRRRFGYLRLAILTLSPGLSADALDAMLGALDGAVLRVFGTGTIPSNPALSRVLQGARERGVALRAVSACENGGLSPGSYAAGAPLWQAGVANGGDDTAEAALVRLWLELSPQG